MSSPDSPLAIAATGLSDADRASTIRAKMQQALTPVLNVLADAKSQGFDVMFSVSTDAFGRATVQQLKVTKEF